MVRQDLGAVVGAVGRQRVDPVGHAAVDIGPRDPRHLPVHPVAHEGVDERVLLRAGDRRAMLTPHELLSLERVEALVQLPRTRARECRQRICPEHLPQCSRELQKLLLLAGECVDPRGDDALQGLGRGARRVAAVCEHARVLLGEQWIALGPLQERGLLIGLEDRRSEQCGEESRGVLVRQRRE